MYRNILVPLDGSAAAQCGLTEAIKLAKSGNAVVRLVHVVNELVMIDPEIPAYYAAMVESLRENGKALLEKAARKVRDHSLDVQSVILESMGGSAADFILEQARAWPADLIVMGTHGRRGLERLVLGSDAEFVVRSSTVPVQLVRSGD